MRVLACFAIAVCAASAACVELPDEPAAAADSMTVEDSAPSADSIAPKDSSATEVEEDAAPATDAGDTAVDVQDATDTTVPADTTVADTFVPPADSGPVTTFAFPRCDLGDTCPASTTDGSALLLGSKSVSGMRSPALSPRSVRFDLNVNLDIDLSVCGGAFIDVWVQSAASGVIATYGPSKPLVVGDSKVSYTTDIVTGGMVPPLKIVVERRAGTGCPSAYVTVKSTSTVTFIP